MSALLAAVLLDPERYRATLAATEPHWFADSNRGATWAQTRRVMKTDPPPPDGPERVRAALAGSAGDPYGLSFAELAEVMEMAPGSHAPTSTPLVEAHLRRATRRGWLDPDDHAERERIANLPAADLIASGGLLPAPGRTAAQRPPLAGGEHRAGFATAVQPAPVLWLDAEPNEPDRDPDAVLSIGEVAILSSAGGLG